MSKSVHVFSTLANDQLYTSYVSSPDGVPVPTSEILIKGGAGIANDRLITPQGAHTEVTEEALGILEKNPVFALHKKNGFITVQARRADPDKVATDMNARDKSKPLTPADYLDKQVDTVISGGKEVADLADAA